MNNQLQVANMKCNGCVNTVKTTLEKLSGVTSVKVSLDKKCACMSGEGIDIEQAINILTDLGFPATPEDICE